MLVGARAVVIWKMQNSTTRKFKVPSQGPLEHFGDAIKSLEELPKWIDSNKFNRMLSWGESFFQRDLFSRSHSAGVRDRLLGRIGQKSASNIYIRE